MNRVVSVVMLLMHLQVYSEVAGYKMSVGKCYVRWGVGTQPATRRTGPITNEELQSLNLKFECAGCGRNANGAVPRD